MKILITGGHISPAVALIKELKKNKKNEIIFVGRAHIQEKELEVSYEYSIIEKQGIPFIHLTTGKLARSVSVQSFLQIIKVLYGLIQSFNILREHKPNVIMSFGGYIGFPICIAGFLLRKKVYIHEQTIRPGISNKIIAKYAKKIFISFPESEVYFPKRKTIITGNIIREDVFKVYPTAFTHSEHRPLLYITGGSIGSHSINIHIEKILEDVLKTFSVIHQTGNIAEYDDYSRLSKIQNPHYTVRPHIYDEEIGWVYKHADVIVSRSGANTICELIALRKPAVLIPLPWSANGEQDEHAKILESAGAVKVFHQNGESKDLLKNILDVYEYRETLKKRYDVLEHYINKDAAQIITEHITK